MTALREHFEQSFYRFRAVNLCIEGRVLLENEMVESGALAHMVSAEQAVAALQLFLGGLYAYQFSMTYFRHFCFVCSALSVITETNKNDEASATLRQAATNY